MLNQMLIMHALFEAEKNTSLFSLVLYQLSETMAWLHKDVVKISHIIISVGLDILWE